MRSALAHHNAQMTCLVALGGAAPALGVSSTARGLRDDLGSRGVRVDLVESEELLTRAAFAPVARELAVTGSATSETLLECVDAFLPGGEDVDVVVCDALFPFVDSLVEWGYGELAIDGFAAALDERLAATTYVQVYLDADIASALRLAADREPEGWLDWYVDQLVRNDPSSLLAPMEQAAVLLSGRRDLTLRLAREHGWHLVHITDTDVLPLDDVRQRVVAALEPFLAP